MTDAPTTVLIADDEFLIQELLTILIERMGLTVCGTAATAEKAIELARAHQPSLILMDMRLEGQQDGVDAALGIRGFVGSKIIFITGSREPKTLTRIQTVKPEAILFKPVADRLLREAVEGALGRQ